MPDFTHAEEELDCAKNELRLVAELINLKERQRHWKNFLNHLDKCWIKIDSGCFDVYGKFQVIQGEVKKKRKDDPLLKYLWHARDADNHSIQSLMEIMLEKEIDGSATVKSDDGTTFVMPIYLYETKLVPYTNKGVTFLPPHYHLGRLVSVSTDAVIVGGLGISYYESILNRTKLRVQ